MTALREAALRYAARGIPVFPLRPRDKSPAIPTAHPEGDPDRGICHGECGRLGHGLYDATAEQGQVWRWWRRWPIANIGVPCGPASGWLAVDLDGAEAEAAWAALERAHGQAPTLVSITGRGRHLIYAWPQGCELGNTSGHLGPRIDTRAAGGFVVVAPSVHPTGQPYRWSQSPWWDVYGPQTPPRWLLEALSEASSPQPRPHAAKGGGGVVGVVPSNLPRHLQQLINSDPGRRGRGAWHLVASALEWGLDDGQVLALIEAHAPSVAKYGGRLHAEVDRIIRKLRPDHRHVGRPCDVADCPRKPRWMVTA